MVWPGTSNSTYIFGGRPCGKCGERDWYIDLFHGHPLILCTSCGSEGLA